jgi:hypothetical protein
MKKLIPLLAASLAMFCGAAEEAIDASDPTKIYTFAGGGPKYSDFTNGEYLWELRFIGNLGLGEHDMVLGEFGYGRIDGSDEESAESGWTDARFRWFHLFDMDYEAIGYRGLGTQVDLQLAGEIRGTDGQNLLVTGVMPTWNFSPNLSLYLSLNLANSWDKRFENYNGLGVGFDAQLIYSNDDWWPGAQVRFIPVYNRFISGELDGDGSGNIDINVGGEFSPTVMWDITFQQNLDKDLKTFRRGRDTDLENDWNIFFNVTSYF